jgi:hypothetical protein
MTKAENRRVTLRPLLEDDDVIRLLRTAVERAGSQVVFAKESGLDRSQINMILSGIRPLSDSVIKALRLRKVYTPE